MLRERLDIARNVARNLAEAERTNDLAIASTAQLIATMMDARLRMNVAASVGQEAFEAAASAFERQATSRRLLIEAHGVLDHTKRFVGLGDYDFGGGGDKEVPQTTGLVQLAEARAA